MYVVQRGMCCTYGLISVEVEHPCFSSSGSQEDLPEGPMECQLPTFSGPHCVAEFAFEAESSGELSLNKGDVVELLERVGGDWLRGRLAGREGIFPNNFVKIIEDLPPAPALGPNIATAVANFEGMDGELSFKVRLVGRIAQLSFAVQPPIA